MDVTPSMLRELFKQKVYDQYGHTWSDNQFSGNWLMKKECWQSRLARTQTKTLSKGDSNEFDPTLLFHLLLYSSLSLLTDEIQNVQCTLVPHSKLVQCRTKQRMFTFLHNGDEVIFDFGKASYKEAIHRVQSAALCLKWLFDPKKVPGVTSFVAKIFRCTDEWHAVYDLSMIRNDGFAHCTSACVSAGDLQWYTTEIKHAFKKLQRSQKLIDHVEAVSKGG
jgi:hypothetical protein